MRKTALALTPMLLCAVPVSSALSQTVVTGTITVTVQDTFGKSINGAVQRCTNCSYTTMPGTVANNSSGTYVAKTTGSNPSGDGIMSTTRYGAYIGTQEYGCQFTTYNTYGTPGSCPAPTAPGAAAYNGKYPSPTCKIALVSVDPNTCNSTYSASMAP